MARTRTPADAKTLPEFGPWFEGAPDAYLVLDRDFYVVGANDAYLRAAGAPREALIGRYLFDLFPDNPDDPKAMGSLNLQASFLRVLATKRPDPMPVLRYDVADERGRFQERYWSTLNTPLLDPAGEVRWILHRVEEVTSLVRLGLPATPDEVAAFALRIQSELETAEGQLRQAQKLEAIGRLAGGVAHDFNNLLSIILGTTGLVRSDLPADSPLHPDLKEIEAAALRAADLTRRLLAFSRQQVLDLRVIELAGVVNEIQPMLQRLVGEDIEQRIRIADDAGRVRADKSQLEQILLNLVVNSRDAMPTGGLLSIEVSNVELSAEYVETHAGVVPGPYAVLTVSDTGCGMDKVTQARAFEPFFTTKPVGQGTGLGLSTVFGIVRQSGGFVWLYSEVGIGTTIKIYLARVDEPASVIDGEALEAIRGGNETILVLEDDDAVRHTVVKILRRLGYRVTSTQYPAEALKLCADRSTAPELLVTDVVMPEMNGRLLAERAAKLVPGIKVLFISGYTDDVVLQHGILTTGAPYLQKPITPEGLGRKVRSALDG